MMGQLRLMITGMLDFDCAATVQDILDPVEIATMFNVGVQVGCVIACTGLALHKSKLFALPGRRFVITV